ncbi:MAG: SMC-Scp complex subunit ScpB, partial [Actinomycetota bacterium]|nr:SMC-Scp complex subunit ScpB [Actinomycetota bacterium]
MEAPAAGSGAGAGAPQDETLPALHDDDELDAALEALLLVVDSPAGEDVLASALGQPVTRVVEALQRLRDGYADRGRGIDLRQVAQGWRLHTRDVYAPFVERLLMDGQRARLT